MATRYGGERAIYTRSTHYRSSRYRSRRDSTKLIVVAAFVLLALSLWLLRPYLFPAPVTVAQPAGATPNTATAPLADTKPTPVAPAAVGSDVSWPQCPIGSKRAKPMPPPSRAKFAVVGLTSGMPFTANPCFAQQVRWLKQRKFALQFYTMATYPDAAQLKRYGGSGPYNRGQGLNMWRNYGWSKARHAITFLKQHGVTKPGRIWIDVEDSKLSWPTGSSAASRNQAVVEGMLAAFGDSRVPVGFYATAYDWRGIMNNWQRPEVPFWETVGPKDRASALRRCGGTGPNGGEVYLVQWWDSSYDWNVSCPGYPVS